MSKASSYRESLLNALTDPEEAVAYLNAGLEESLPAFLKTLKNVTQAHQMTKIAKDSGVQRETLYRSLSEQGNPTLQTLTSVLTAMGLRIKVERDVPDNQDVSGEADKTEKLKEQLLGQENQPLNGRVNNQLVTTFAIFTQSVGGSSMGHIQSLGQFKPIEKYGPLGVSLPMSEIQAPLCEWR